MSRQRICIIAFKAVDQCIHVLRQIEYLAPEYDLTVIGYGMPGPRWPSLAWHALPEPAALSKLTKLLWFAPGRMRPSLYDSWYWRTARHRLALAYATASGADAFHANDWSSLPVAVEAARRGNGRVVFHMHEYAEQERADSVPWRLLVGPAIRSLTRKYTSLPDSPIDASITVCDPIAQRYRRELGLRPIVVFNAPKPVDVLPREDMAGARRIRLIHHGYAKRGRGLHRLIHALALTDERFALDFMLMEDDRGYIDELERMAERLAPGRIRFRSPVPPDEIVHCVAEYDVGLCVIQPSSYNNLMMLPNKLFEYIQAGLAVCIGPSPAMVGVVRKHGVGVVASSFEPNDIAATLNRLTWQEVGGKKQAARRAAAVLNADVEMGKILEVYRRLFDSGDRAARRGGEESGGRDAERQLELAAQ